MADTSKSPSVGAAQFRSQLDELRATDPAPKLAEAKQRVADTVMEAVVPPIQQGLEQGRGAVANARRTAAQVGAPKDRLSQRVRSQPLVTLGIAMLIGYMCDDIVR